MSSLTTFLEHFRPDGYTTFVAIVPDGSTTTRTFNGVDPKAAIDWLKAQNESKGLYYTLNGTSAGQAKKPTKAEITKVHGLHADLDPRDGAGHDYEAERERLAALADELAALPCPPTYIVDSGNGVQPVWLLAKPRQATAARVEAAEALNRRIEAALGAQGTHNIDRLLRLPGAVNYPNARKRKLGRGRTRAKLLSATWRRYRWTRSRRWSPGSKSAR